jgi:uncharacterized repeat protein (TIGR01451 family)
MDALQRRDNEAANYSLALPRNVPTDPVALRRTKKAVPPHEKRRPTELSDREALLRYVLSRAGCGRLRASWGALRLRCALKEWPMPRYRAHWFLACTLLCAARPAFAQRGEAALRAADSSGLELAATVERITEPPRDDAQPQRALTPLEGRSAEPGEEVVYTVAFTNVSGRALADVRITTPIPAELSYTEGSATGPGAHALFSIDGGRTFGAPAELPVSGSDGATQRAAAAQYTHIRWILPATLEAGAKGFVRFRALAR